ncbi:MAG: CinA family protein [Treponema sp.]|nr:CinA family protein [Treponema sp.]
MPECKALEALNKRAEETAAAVMEKLKSSSLTLALAESCTAGLVSSLLVNTSGASAHFWGSFVCYKQEAKTTMLGINNDELLTNGTVSRETAIAMAENTLRKSTADITASVTGFAGPTGDDKTSGGTVWTAVALRDGKVDAKEFRFSGGRNIIRVYACIAVLEEILQMIPNP